MSVWRDINGHEYVYDPRSADQLADRDPMPTCEHGEVSGRCGECLETQPIAGEVY